MVVALISSFWRKFRKTVSTMHKMNQMTMVAVVFTLITVLSEMLQNLLTEILKKLSMVHAKYYITHHSREMAMKL